MHDYEIEIIRKGEIVPENELGNIFSFYAWPTVGRLKDGNLIAVCSGARTIHIDPFGKVMAFYSKDEGKTWTKPFVLADTPYDDRDAGFLLLNDGRVMITSFNTTTEYQLSVADYEDRTKEQTELFFAYLDMIKDLPKPKSQGFYMLSDDGYVFNKGIKYSPVHTPHGPTKDKNGKIYFVGEACITDSDVKGLALYTSDDAENWQLVHQFDDKVGEYTLTEPSCYFCDDGTMVVMARGQNPEKDEFGIFMCQFIATSKDNGKTFTPFTKTDIVGGPVHIMRANDGTFICSHGYRGKPYAERVAFSKDGKIWTKSYDIINDSPKFDHGYPSTVQLKDGSFMTVYYQGHIEKTFTNNSIKYVVWKYKEI